MGQLSGDVVIQQPAAITPILELAGSPDITPELQHTVIKTVHDLFLQNDSVKCLFLDHDLTRLLCNLLCSKLERTVKLGVPLVDETGQDKIGRMEEDILGYLKAIALYGCMTNTGIAIADDILVVKLSNICRLIHVVI